MRSKIGPADVGLWDVGLWDVGLWDVGLWDVALVLVVDGVARPATHAWSNSLCPMPLCPMPLCPMRFPDGRFLKNGLQFALAAIRTSGQTF